MSRDQIEAQLCVVVAGSRDGWSFRERASKVVVPGVAGSSPVIHPRERLVTPEGCEPSSFLATASCGTDVENGTTAPRGFAEMRSFATSRHAASHCWPRLYPSK